MGKYLLYQDDFNNLIKQYISIKDSKTLSYLKDDIEKLFLIILNEEEKIKNEVSSFIKQNLGCGDAVFTVFWYSCLLKLNPNHETITEFLEYILSEKRLETITKYFLFYQLKHNMFINKSLETEESKYLIWKLFQEIYNEYRANSVIRNEIPLCQEQRNKNLIVVITEQFLGETHGPTKTALDRCETIIQHLHKEVILINTGEVLTESGSVPYFMSTKANYVEEFGEYTEQHWKGLIIPFLQIKKGMPDMSIINQMLLLIKEMSPLCIVSIGGNSMLANLCNDIAPVVSIGLCPSDYEYTCTSFQTLGRNLAEEERLLKRLGIPMESIIQCTFTSGLKPQEVQVTKKQLGIPEDKFIVAVIGGRLQAEVTKDFAEMIRQFKGEDIIFVFAGQFIDYNLFVKENALIDNSIYIGFQEDILAFLDNVDLYVNPLRKGGGTSAVEALYKGVPVISIPYGDAAINAGEDFLVKDYGEMADRIMDYRSNKEFYDKMSIKAKKRANVLLDTKSEFSRIIKEVLDREILAVK